MQRFEILILGGSFTGMVTALALHKAGFDVALIEKSILSNQLDKNFDGRGHSIARASQHLLQNLELWSDIEAFAQPVAGIKTWDSQTKQSVCLTTSVLGSGWTGPMAWIAENQPTRAVLVEKTAQALGNRLFQGKTTQAIDLFSARPSVTLEDGTLLRADLLLACDGRNSVVRQAAGIKTTTIDYKKRALVAEVHHELNHGGIARQTFQPSGPFATLPLLASPTQEHRSSMVWSLPADLAEAMTQLPIAELEESLNSCFGSALGRLKLHGKVGHFPLTAHQASAYVQPGLALLGDAAHSIHPIAGQGFNLALRDIACLTDVLIQMRGKGSALGQIHGLDAYQTSRRPDAMAMMTATDGIERLYGSQSTPIVQARALGQKLLQRAAIPQQDLILFAMGLKQLGQATLPTLMQETKAV